MAQLKEYFFKYNAIFLSTGDQLFDHIASCLAEFVEEQEIEDDLLPLGFTFSFPCQQEGLAKVTTVTREKLPNVYKSCPKMIDFA